MSDHAELRKLAEAANWWGPWAVWRDLTEDGFVTVGNLDGVIPEGEISTPDDAEANPIAKCYTPEIAEFVAAAHPASVLALLDELAEARAALVAAQGAAPQAEAYDHCCNHPKCPGGSLCCCASEQRLRDCWNQWREEVAGNTKQAFRDAYSAGRNDPAPWAVAPALSGGVDEDKLAEVIARVTDLWDDPLDEVHDIPQITRAVAAWLKERGNAARE